MALKDMIEHIQKEVQKEMEDQINKAKIDVTQSLISLGEELDQLQEEKLYFFTNNLKKREEILKAEQHFFFTNQELSAENEFVRDLLKILKDELLNYVLSHRKDYEKILKVWLTKINKALSDMVLTISVNQQDEHIIKQLLSELSINSIIETKQSIKAGFFVQGEMGVTVDLTFDTLFLERQEQLLNISMQILKENL